MNWFRRSIDKAVKRGVEQSISEFCAPGGGLDDVIERCVWKHLDETLSRTNRLTRLGFTWALRLVFNKHGLSYAEASRYANDTLFQYLKDEKIKFGDPAYSWTRADAEEIADEYEFRHWDAAA